jgi:hypothetical protein
MEPLKVDPRDTTASKLPTCRRQSESQPIDWWTVARKVGILMVFVYGSRFVGRIIANRGFSFLAPSEYNPGAP